MRARQRWPDTPPLYDTPLAKAASEAGGVLISVQLQLPVMPPPSNDGCGTPTFVAGTNGGMMPCGAMLTLGAITAPYYCAQCQTEKGLRCYHNEAVDKACPI